MLLFGQSCDRIRAEIVWLHKDAYVECDVANVAEVHRQVFDEVCLVIRR